MPSIKGMIEWYRTPWLDRDAVERGQDRAVGAEVGDGIDRAAAQFRGDHVGSVQGLDLGDARVHLGGPAHQVGDGLAKTAVGDRAAAMGRGDEHDPAHEGQGLEDENVVERLLDFRRRP